MSSKKPLPNLASEIGIEHVFVLMLENRSFDHMLGFSGITGTDAVTDQPTTINGLTGSESNSFNEHSYTVTPGADNPMAHDPGHDFPDVVEQLCGQGATYVSGGPYPCINSSGFVANYMEHYRKAEPCEIMMCQTPSQVPILTALARGFAVCDNWFSSLPGPTWPNRFFLHAASSGGLDHAPSKSQMKHWEMSKGFAFQNGTIFDALKKAHINYRIYSGGTLTIVAGLKGIDPLEIRSFYGIFGGSFAEDVSSGDYPAQYTFIEPCYGHLGSNYTDGNSQHPLDGVANGEGLIYDTYRAISKSPVWEKSLLIVTYDEHGGFYDHVAPPHAITPGDEPLQPDVNSYGFTFRQYGLRVPAVIISPLIPQNIIDHRKYDHTSVLATLEALFGLPPLTQRDANANTLIPLLSLQEPRQDTPAISPALAEGDVKICPLDATTDELLDDTPLDSLRGDDNLGGFLHVALRTDLAVSSSSEHPDIMTRFDNLKTRGDAQQYISEVQRKFLAAKGASSTVVE